MPKWQRWPAPLVGALAAYAALLSAPCSVADPVCTDTGPNTTQCENPGNAQIVTTPPIIDPYPWWPYGGFVISFGGWGL